MFMNKVSVKDLFTTNPGRQQESSDSALSSGSQNNYSQNNYSQFPFSQLDDSQLTQDPGSQHSGESPSRKFYQRYASTAKAHIFAKETNQKQLQGSRSMGAQQLQINKARARERDERDILQTLVSSVKDCTAEVKGVVVMVNETLQDGSLKSEEKLREYLEKIQSGLSKYNENLVQCLQSKEATETKILELTKEVSEKDGRIKELEKQLQNMRKENFDRLLEDMEDVYKEHHNQLETRVQATTSEQQKALNLHTQQQEKYLHKLMQHNDSRTSQVMEQFKDKTLALMDEKLEEGVASQIKTIKKELSREVQDEIYSLQCDHRKKIEELINQQVEQLRGSDVEGKNELMEKQKYQVQQLQSKLREDLDRLINDKVCSVSMEHKSQMEMVVEQLWRQEKHRTDVQHQEQMKHFKEQIRQYYEQTLEDLKQRHRREMESIVAQRGPNNNPYNRFYSSHAPGRTHDNDSANIDHFRRRGIGYEHNSSDRQLDLLSPTISRTNRDYKYGQFRDKYEHPLSRSPAMCNVVDPILLSPKPYPRPPGSKLDKLFSQPRSLPATSSIGIVSPMSTVSQGFNASMIFSTSMSVNSPAIMAAKETAAPKNKEKESQNKCAIKKGKRGNQKKNATVKRKAGKVKKKQGASGAKGTRGKSGKNESQRSSNSEPMSTETDDSKEVPRNQHMPVRKSSRGSFNDVELYHDHRRSDVTSAGKRAQQHIRFSPPMYGQGAQIRKPKDLVKSSSSDREDITFMKRQYNPQNSAQFNRDTEETSVASFRRSRNQTSRNFSNVSDIFEFDDVPPSPLYISSQKRRDNIDQCPDENEGKDERWQNARSIGPTQNSQIVTRKTYGRFNNGASVSYQETVMTQMQNNTDRDVDTMSQTSSPSMSVAELKIKHFYKTPPAKAYTYHDKWRGDQSPPNFLSSYKGHDLQITDVTNNESGRQLRSRKRKQDEPTATEMVYVQAVKKPRKRKT